MALYLHCKLFGPEKADSYPLPRPFEEEDELADSGHRISVIDDMPSVGYQGVVFSCERMIACRKLVDFRCVKDRKL